MTDRAVDVMSLRDYFAAKAMLGLTMRCPYPQQAFFELAKRSYEIADAMLEARQDETT